MAAIFWYGGAAGAVLCAVLILVKTLLFVLGADFNPRLMEISDKLPSTRLCLLGMFLFTVSMLMPLLFL